MEKPIIFSTPMVRALLEGRKTQTRRIVKLTEFGLSDTPGYKYHFRDKRFLWNDVNENLFTKFAPYRVGDHLWVRETYALPWAVDNVKPSEFLQEAILNFIAEKLIWYKADKCEPLKENPTVAEKVQGRGKWRPSIFMLKELSRLCLEVTNVRVERLQDISREDAIVEGLQRVDLGPAEYGFHDKKNNPKFWSNPVHAYSALWESINGNGSWHQNPWVFVIEFKILKGDS
jgi:hypothetical protein